jgi:uncharacterized membrane protein YdjX (TVP38/TMEM64 family)
MSPNPPVMNHTRLRNKLPWAAFFCLLATVYWSFQAGGLFNDLLGPERTAVQRIARLREYFESCGSFAPVVYVLFVTIEVIVAPIPGLMLYAPGGLVFGPWLGGTLAVIGNTIGAGLACLLVRSLGTQWITSFFDANSVSKVQDRLEQSGPLLIFFLRLNPLTSTDLLSFAAGFTKISVWRVMLATGFGMAPLCYAQSWLSDSLFHKFPMLIYPLLVAGLIYIVVIAVIFHRLLAPSRTGSAKQSPDGEDHGPVGKTTGTDI